MKFCTCYSVGAPEERSSPPLRPCGYQIFRGHPVRSVGDIPVQGYSWACRSAGPLLVNRTNIHDSPFYNPTNPFELFFWGGGTRLSDRSSPSSLSTSRETLGDQFTHIGIWGGVTSVDLQSLGDQRLGRGGG